MKRIIFNHKSYLTYDEINNYKKEISKLIPENYELIIFPQMIYLTMFKNVKYKIGAQNFYSYNSGSFTGEANIKSLKSINVNYLLLGHSERKELVNETYSLIRNKLFKSLNAKVDTTLCIGELKREKSAIKYIKKELNYYMHNLESDNIDYLTIAYEPAWAIGGFETLPTDEIKKTVEVIKKYFQKKYNKEIKVLYGGSVTKDDINEILEVTDGVLIGKDSSDITKVKELIKVLN